MQLLALDVSRLPSLPAAVAADPEVVYKHCPKGLVDGSAWEK